MTPLLVKRIARYFAKRENALGFEFVEDPRAKRGRRWTLRSLLRATFLGMCAMHRDFRGVERLTRDMCGCRRRFGIPRRVPDSTLARVFTGLRDEGGLRQCLVDDIRRAQRRKALAPAGLPVGVVAIDGKTIWCSPKPVDDPACQDISQDGRPCHKIHTLHAVLVSASSQPCVDQMLVPAETNEMRTLPLFVEQLRATYGDSLFEVLSVDAGMTSSENARVITSAGYRYVMAVKGSQPTLLAESERLCGWGEHKQRGYLFEAATFWERYRGKRMRRELYRSSEIQGWPGWESARQLWRVKQITEHADGRREVVNRYFITNLPWGRLSASEVLTLVRLHWGVENGCHWTLDVQLGEDQHPWCTKGQALRMLSCARLSAYNAVRMLKQRYLRSEENRAMPWADLRRAVQLTFCLSLGWGKDAMDQEASPTL